MSWWTRLTKLRILKALAEGGLQGFTGQGRLLPDRSGNACVDAGEAGGFRIIAEAAVLPEEIILKKKIAAQRAVLRSLTGAEGRKAAMTRLSDREIRHAIAKRRDADFCAVNLSQIVVNKLDDQSHGA